MSAGDTVLKRAVQPYYPPAGTYGVVRTRGLIPWIIRAATKSPYDHAFIVVDDEGAIVEAEPGGARHNRIDDYEGHRIALNLGETTTADQRRIIAQAATDAVGEPYNTLGIIDDGLESLGARWAWLAKYAAGDGEVLCSQLVAVCGRKAGLDWLCGKAYPGEVTPADLARRPGMQPWPAAGL